MDHNANRTEELFLSLISSSLLFPLSSTNSSQLTQFSILLHFTDKFGQPRPYERQGYMAEAPSRRLALTYSRSLRYVESRNGSNARVVELATRVATV